MTRTTTAIQKRMLGAEPICPVTCNRLRATDIRHYCQSFGEQSSPPGVSRRPPSAVNNSRRNVAQQLKPFMTCPAGGQSYLAWGHDDARLANG